MASPNDKVTDPFEYLKEDHKKVAGILEKIDGTTEAALKTREELFKKLNEELSLHAEVEEHALYPVLDRMGTTHEIALEAYEEHHVVKLLLKELSLIQVDSDEWTAKFKVLKENIEHHVEEEEAPDGMFTMAKGALDEGQLLMVGEEMEAFLKGADSTV